LAEQNDDKYVNASITLAFVVSILILCRLLDFLQYISSVAVARDRIALSFVELCETSGWILKPGQGVMRQRTDMRQNQSKQHINSSE
jgi:hypothetical protein